MTQIKPIDLSKIGYVDEPDTEFCNAVSEARLLDDLRAVGLKYAPLFPDAAVAIAAIADDEEFLRFRKGLRSERRGQFAGEAFMEKFGAILLPANIIHIGTIAAKFGVPFGCAYIRLRQAGRLTERNGVATLLAPAAQ